MQPRSHPDLLKGSINQNIIRMSLPMMVANFSGTIAAYGVYWWRFPKGG